MTDDKTITMTVAELRALRGLCAPANECARLATKQDVGYEYELACDAHGLSDFVELEGADLIRAVQARIDGLSAQPAVERWVIRFQMPVSGTAYVKGVGVFTYNEADANTWATEADAREWAGRALSVGSYNVVRL